MCEFPVLDAPLAEALAEVPADTIPLVVPLDAAPPAAALAAPDSVAPQLPVVAVGAAVAAVIAPDAPPPAPGHCFGTSVRICWTPLAHVAPSLQEGMWSAHSCLPCLLDGYDFGCGQS